MLAAAGQPLDALDDASEQVKNVLVTWRRQRAKREPAAAILRNV